MFCCPYFLTNHSFPADIFMKTVLVAQSLLKLEPFLLCGPCMFLFFFRDYFLNVLLCSLTNHSFSTDFFFLTVLVAQSLLKLENFLLYLHCMFLYFFMGFLNVLLCCFYFFNKPFISHRYLYQNSLSGPIPSEIGALSSLRSLYVSLFFHGFPKCFIVMSLLL